MPARVCWSCQRRFATTTADATLHRYVDYTFTVHYPCRQCGCENQEWITGVELQYLLACGVHIVEPDEYSIIFADQVRDEALVDAYMKLWARQ